jgi:death-on-curing protein
MNDPHFWVWVDRDILLALHDESLAEHGGASGIRDTGLFESALNRPLNLVHYGKPDVAELAASYGYGLAKNHPFIDGNKRAALLGIGLFLMMNGYRLIATQDDTTKTILALATGELTEEALVDWIQKNIKRK